MSARQRRSSGGPIQFCGLVDACGLLFAAITVAGVVSCSKVEPTANDAHNEGHSEGSTQHHDEVALSAEAVESNGIVLATVVRHELLPTFRVPAQVAFNKDGMAHVGSPVKGRVSDLRVKLGDNVQKNDVLAIIESPELGEAQSDYLQKRSAAQTAVPAVELAKNAHERAKGLYERTQGIPLTEVQKREVEFRAAQATLQAAKTGEQAAENRLHLLGMDQEAVTKLSTTGEIDPRFGVRAPITGQVIEREVTLGELVGPDREALLILADLSRLWVLADVPETRLRETAVGARARVLLGAEQNHWCEGTVSFISPALDPSTRSVRVRIEATDKHPELRPGVFAQAEITTTTEAGAKAVLAVPEKAVQTVEGESAVFVPVPGEANRFAKRNVRVGVPVNGLVPVLAGLSEGEVFVAEGSFILKAELGKSSAEHED